MIQLHEYLLVQPPLSIAVTLMLSVISIAVVVWLYIRDKQRRHVLRVCLAGLRLMTLFIISFLLIGPLRATTQMDTSTLSHHVLWILDDSLSMNEPVDTQKTSRINQAQNAIDSPQTAHSETSVANRYYLLSEEPQSVIKTKWLNATANRESSPLLRSTLNLLNQPVTPAGDLVLISDGADTSDSARQTALTRALIQLAQSQNRQIHTIVTGLSSEKPAIQWSIWPNKDKAFINESFKIHSDIQWRKLEPQRLKLTLYQDDILRFTRHLQVSEDQNSTQVTFDLTAVMSTKANEEIQTWRLEITDMDGQPIQADNPQTGYENYAFIKVIDERIRVLVIDGSVGWDTSFLVRSIKSDPRLDITTIFQITDDRRAIQRYRPTTDEANTKSDEKLIPPGPLSLETLQRYDAVLLGKDVDGMIHDNALTLIHYIGSGAGVFLFRGQPFKDKAQNQALMTALPLEWANRTRKAVSLRATHDFFDQPQDIDDAKVTYQLPTLVTLTQEAKIKPNATTLIRLMPGQNPNETKALPALVSGHHGQGRAMIWLMNGSWRWAFAPNQAFDFLPVYTTLHSQAVRWLALNEAMFDKTDLDLNVSQLRAGPDESIRITITSPWRPVTDWKQAPTLTIKELKSFEENSKDEGRTVITLPLKSGDLRPDTWTTTFKPSQTGHYVFELKWTDFEGVEQSRSAPLLVTRDVLEARYLEPNPSLMRKLADGTGGRFFQFDSSDVSNEDTNAVAQTSLTEVINHIQQRSNEQHTAQVNRETTWYPWVSWGPPIIVIVMLLSLEWFLRKGFGLDQ